MLNDFLNSRMSVAGKLVADLEKKFDYASILGSFTTSTRIMSNTRTSSVNEIDNESGFVIKVYKDGHYSEYSINDIKDLSADEIVKAVTLSSYPSSKSLPMLNEKEHKESYLREDQEALSNEDILKALNSCRKKIQKYDERIVDATCFYIKRQVSKTFISSRKTLDQKYDWVNCICQIMIKGQEGMKMHYFSRNGVNTLSALNSFKKSLNKELKIAIDLLNAKPIEAGEYDIITDPSISGLIAHEAFGHGVELDMFVKNRAMAKDYVGKYVASKYVNMFDGAASTLSSASYFFDDDGIEAGNTQIIKNGILQTGISDALSALQLGLEPTGNGRRESYSHKVYSRMTNTFFAPGKSNVNEMIASIKHGYLLCSTNNGMEDPKNWQIQCTASYGLEIVDGKLSGKIVAPVVISGNVIELLSSITMVSKQWEVIGSGMCGKGHKEWVYVADGGPYLKGRAKLG